MKKTIEKKRSTVKIPANLPELRKQRAVAFLEAQGAHRDIDSAERAAEAGREGVKALRASAAEIEAKAAKMETVIKQLESEAKDYRDSYQRAFLRFKDADTLVERAHGTGVLKYRLSEDFPDVDPSSAWRPGKLVETANGEPAWTGTDWA